jgi:hypothetical protein
MIDDCYTPYLIEVNTNPCLELSCPLLEGIIPQLIENTLKYLSQYQESALIPYSLLLKTTKSIKKPSSAAITTFRTISLNLSLMNFCRAQISKNCLRIESEWGLISATLKMMNPSSKTMVLRTGNNKMHKSDAL